MRLPMGDRRMPGLDVGRHGARLRSGSLGIAGEVGWFSDPAQDLGQTDGEQGPGRELAVADNRLAVEERSIAAVEVPHRPPAGVGKNLRMLPAGPLVQDDDVIRRCPTH
jgi:hypothetical protein